MSANIWSIRLQKAAEALHSPKERTLNYQSLCPVEKAVSGLALGHCLRRCPGWAQPQQRRGDVLESFFDCSDSLNKFCQLGDLLRFLLAQLDLDTQLRGRPSSDELIFSQLILHFRLHVDCDVTGAAIFVTIAVTATFVDMLLRCSLEQWRQLHVRAESQFGCHPGCGAAQRSSCLCQTLQLRIPRLTFVVHF
ncbi:hypothetical protein XENOCAPTIV_012990 [Xenoophorus captivus]|uniref:Uncharacterized protein n=1 Tax=Xenoophorus captivus TaxID=1517983 RepID=A0ABV0RQI2_9TELE